MTSDCALRTLSVTKLSITKQSTHSQTSYTYIFK